MSALTNLSETRTQRHTHAPVQCFRFLPKAHQKCAAFWVQTERKRKGKDCDRSAWKKVRSNRGSLFSRCEKQQKNSVLERNRRSFLLQIFVSTGTRARRSLLHRGRASYAMGKTKVVKVGLRADSSHTPSHGGGKVKNKKKQKGNETKPNWRKSAARTVPPKFPQKKIQLPPPLPATTPSLNTRHAPPFYPASAWRGKGRIARAQSPGGGGHLCFALLVHPCEVSEASLCTTLM